jgi:hypothetical protein
MMDASIDTTPFGVVGVREWNTGENFFNQSRSKTGEPQLIGFTTE